MANADEPLHDNLLLSTLERMVVALEKLADNHQRLVDHVAPMPPNLVGTPYVAGKLGCTTVWITQLVHSGEIPLRCVVPGTGNGKPWKFYRDRIDAWIKSR